MLSKILDFYTYFVTWSNLTSIFQMGWNHPLPSSIVVKVFGFLGKGPRSCTNHWFIDLGGVIDLEVWNSLDTIPVCRVWCCKLLGGSCCFEKPWSPFKQICFFSYICRDRISKHDVRYGLKLTYWCHRWIPVLGILIYLKQFCVFLQPCPPT